MLVLPGDEIQSRVDTAGVLPARTEDDGGQDATPDVKALLQPLEEAHCIFKTKDWWTYEICYNRQIKQYHVENDRPVGAVMVLGVHRYLPLDCIV